MLMPGAPVESTGAPLSAELGPGLLGMIYDGIQRPLPALLKRSGGNLARGVHVSALPRRENGTLCPRCKKGRWCSREMFLEPYRKRRQWSTVF